MLKVLLLLFSIPLLATNGYQQIGHGTKALGMGGVAITLPQEALVIAANPAGIAYLGNRVDASLQWRHMRAELRVRPISTNAFDNRYHTTKNLIRPDFGLTICLDSNKSLGLAIYRLGGFKVDYGRSIVEIIQLQPVASLFPPQSKNAGHYEAYMASPAFAWRINSCHTLGASFNVAFASFNIQGLQPFANAQNSIAPNQVTNKGTDYAQGMGFTVGWIGHINACWQVGLSYRSRTWMNHFQRYRGFIAREGNLDIPAQLGLSFTYWPSPCFAISADGTRIMWGDIRIWGQDQTRVGLYGDDDGRGFGWKDQWVAKVGFQWETCPSLTLRGGWNYGNTQTGGPEVLINSLNQQVIEHHFTGGATYTCGCHELSIAYVHALFHNLAFFTTSRDRHDKLKSRENIVSLTYSRRF